MFQPLKAIGLILAFSGCGIVATKTSVGVVPASLHSEFKQVDGNNSTFGPFLAASKAQHESNNTDSAEYYMQALEADPSSRFVADRAFFQLLVSGRVNEAALLATKINTDTTTDEDDLVRLMSALEAFKRNEWAVVRSRLEGPADGGFGYIIYPILRAWSFGAEGNLEAARQALDKMAQNKRLDSLADEHLAYILDYMGRPDEAVEVYERLIKNTNNQAAQSTVAYAHLLYRQGKKQEARDFLAAKTKKSYNRSFLLREGMRIASGDVPTQHVTTPHGAASMVFFRLAKEFSQGTSYQAAVVYFRIATFLTPDVPEIYYRLGEIFRRSGQAAGAVTAFQAVPSKSYLGKSATKQRAEALIFGGHVDDAEGLIRNSLAERPDDHDMQITLANILRHREQYQEALSIYDFVLSKRSKPLPADWYTYFTRGVLHERIGNWDKAEEDLQMALSLSSGEPLVLNYLGYSWIDRGKNIENAKAMIEKAVSKQPDNGAFVDSLGWVYYLTGDYAAAVTALEQAVRLEPDDATINDHLGDAYWRVGRKLEARFQWRHALDGESLTEEDRLVIKRKLEDGLAEKNLAEEPPQQGVS